MIVRRGMPSIAASRLLRYDGDRFPGWHGNLFAGGLGGQQLGRLMLQVRVWRLAILLPNVGTAMHTDEPDSAQRRAPVTSPV